MTARDDLVKGMSALTRNDLIDTALTLADVRGEEYIIGGPRAMSKDELVRYIVGPQPAWQQRTEARR
jgi:hypothetical protein